MTDAKSKGTTDKKEVCRSFRNNNGECRFGDTCKYEHSKGEAIPVPERDYKPKGDCNNWAKDKSCRFGDRCRFVHGSEDKRETYRPKKTENTSGEQEVCRMFEKRGKCRFGDRCKHKHVAGEKKVSDKKDAGKKSDQKDGESKTGGRRRRRRGPGDKTEETKVEAAKYDKEGVEICRNFSQKGNCRFGEECTYSHGSPDPNAKPKPGSEKPASSGRGGRRRRTRGASSSAGRSSAPKAPGQCYNFEENGSCEFGDECRFKHGDGDKRDFTRKPAKKAPGVCYNFQENGECEYGADCRFSHDPADRTD
jgi:hypothetical protein